MSLAVKPSTLSPLTVPRRLPARLTCQTHGECGVSVMPVLRVGCIMRTRFGGPVWGTRATEGREQQVVRPTPPGSGGRGNCEINMRHSRSREMAAVPKGHCTSTLMRAPRWPLWRNCANSTAQPSSTAPWWPPWTKRQQTRQPTHGHGPATGRRGPRTAPKRWPGPTGEGVRAARRSCHDLGARRPSAGPRGGLGGPWPAPQQRRRRTGT